MAKSKPIKVCLTNQGADTETPWAEDLGPAPGHLAGARKVRLINVPFMHAKPTWGDTIVVRPVEDGFPTWDRGGVPFAQITTRIAEDGGRWAMIVDYAPHPDASNAFDALVRACAEHDVVCEGAWGPRADGEPGRVYLAVRNELGDTELMQRLRASSLPCELVQIHPEPMIKPRPKQIVKRAAPKPAAAPSPVAAKTIVKKVQKAVALPASPPVAKAAEKPVAKAAAEAVAPPASSPVAKAAAKPVATAVAKPVAKPAAKPPAKPVAKPPAKPVAKPPAKPVAKPAAKPVAKPAAKPIAKPAAKTVVKPAAKPSAKLAAKSSPKKPTRA